MSFIKKLIGLDNSAAVKAAQDQARIMQEQAEATRRQSQAIAEQTAQQQRQAADRARVEEQVRLMQEANKPEEVVVDVGEEGEDAPAARRRRAYQNPNAGASGAIRI
jgi:hypothetical protein